MSIIVRDGKEEKSSGFSVGGITLPDLKPKSSSIIIDTKNTNMEAKKKEEMEKKKEEPKFFYELLAEAAEKKMMPSIHRGGGNYNYSCPIAVVLDLLGEKPRGVNNDDSCGCTTSHGTMVEQLRQKGVKFQDIHMNYCYTCDEDGRGDAPNDNYDDDNDDFSVPCGHGGDGKSFNEPMLAIHISRWHAKGHAETAKILRESLYEGKRPSKKLSRTPTHSMFETRTIPGTLSSRIPLGAERMYIRNSFGNIEEVSVRDYELARHVESPTIRPSLGITEEDEDED